MQHLLAKAKTLTHQYRHRLRNTVAMDSIIDTWQFFLAHDRMQRRLIKEAMLDIVRRPK